MKLEKVSRCDSLTLFLRHRYGPMAEKGERTKFDEKAREVCEKVLGPRGAYRLMNDEKKSAVLDKAESMVKDRVEMYHSRFSIKRGSEAVKCIKLKGMNVISFFAAYFGKLHKELQGIIVGVAGYEK